LIFEESWLSSNGRAKRKSATGYSSGAGDVHGIAGSGLKRAVDDLDNVSVADEAISCFTPRLDSTREPKTRFPTDPRLWRINALSCHKLDARFSLDALTESATQIHVCGGRLPPAVCIPRRIPLSLGSTGNDGVRYDEGRHTQRD
jgi:hypothetical protein